MKAGNRKRDLVEQLTKRSNDKLDIRGKMLNVCMELSKVVARSDFSELRDTMRLYYDEKVYNLTVFKSNTGVINIVFTAAPDPEKETGFWVAGTMDRNVEADSDKDANGEEASDND